MTELINRAHFGKQTSLECKCTIPQSHVALNDMFLSYTQQGHRRSFSVITSSCSTVKKKLTAPSCFENYFLFF